MPITTTGPTVEKLEALEELVLERVTVSDILTYTEGRAISASWLIRGDGLITISLAKAVITRRNEDARTATIVLPRPTVLSARVDHESTVFWDAKQGIWNKVNPWGTNLDDIHSQAMRAAQRLVTQAVGSPENLEQAQQRAAALIQRLYDEFGWTITIEWQISPREPAANPDRSSPEVMYIPANGDGRFWSLSEVSSAGVTAAAL